MARELKVYGVRYFSALLRHGHGRAIVATTSKASAARLIGVSITEMRDYGSATSSPPEVAAALAQPGVALIELPCKPGAQMRFIPISVLKASTYKKNPEDESL